MSVEQNKAIVRRYYEGDGDGRDNTENWSELCDANMVLYAATFPEPVRGLEPIKQFTQAAHSAMSNYSITAQELIGEDDKVVARWMMGGTNTAPLPMPGFPPYATGKTMAVSGISILRLAGGKITEERVEADWLGMMVQLGALPAPAGAA